MGKKDKCCDRYKKKDKYCSGCPIVDSCELAPRPEAAKDREELRRGRPPCRPEEATGKQAKKDKKDKKEKKERKQEKDRKEKKEKKVNKDKKGRKDKKEK